MPWYNSGTTEEISAMLKMIDVVKNIEIFSSVDVKHFCGCGGCIWARRRHRSKHATFSRPICILNGVNGVPFCDWLELLHMGFFL